MPCGNRELTDGGGLTFMFAAESSVAAADRGALALLEPEDRVKCWKHRGTNSGYAEETQTFLEKDTVLDEFLQELRDGSGSFFTSVR